MSAPFLSEDLAHAAAVAVPSLSAKRAPKTLSVYDRKINVESLPPDPSLYYLAREWVTNNPFRSTHVRSSTLPSGGSVQLPAPLPPTPLSTARLLPAKRKVAELELNQSRASPALILEHHVQHARDVRRWVKAQRQCVLDRFRCATLLPRIRLGS